MQNRVASDYRAKTQRIAANYRIEQLEHRRLMAVDISVVSITARSKYLGPNDIFVKVTTTLKNNVADSFSAISLDNAGGNVVYSRDSVLGNADDIVGLGSIYEVTLAGGQTISSDGEFVRPNLTPGPYYMGSKFINIDYKTKKIITRNYITPTPIITVLGAADLQIDSLSGTTANDLIFLEQDGSDRYVTLNGVTQKYASTQRLYIDSGAGNDKIIAYPGWDLPLLITGSGDDDTIVGGSANDSFSGGNGKDKLWGGGGNDNMLGGAKNDYLNGGLGNDVCSGAGGNDILSDVEGTDYLLGGSGNDVFVSRDLVPNISDSISGGSGYDRAQLDGVDGRASIEELLA